MTTDATPPPATPAPAPPPAADTPPPAAAASPAAGEAAPPPAWKSLGIPSHMLKETPEDTLAEVFKGLKGYRDRDAQQGPVGKAPEDYRFEFADEVKPYFQNTDDPALKAFQAVAHKLNLPVKHANAILNEVFAPLAREGKLPPPFDPKAELAAMGKLLGKEGPDAGPAIEQATVELQGFTGNLGQQLKLTEQEQVELESLMLTAPGFGLLRKLQGAGAQNGGFRLGGTQPGVLSKEEVLAMPNDPRWRSDDPRFDPEFRARYEREYERLRQGRR